MNDERKYAIDKYYMLEQINETTSVLVEKFMVVELMKSYIGLADVYRIFKKDGFNSYGDALKHIEYLLEIPKLNDKNR